jgi:hypothetical protein
MDRGTQAHRYPPGGFYSRPDPFEFTPAGPFSNCLISPRLDSGQKTNIALIFRAGARPILTEIQSQRVSVECEIVCARRTKGP